MVAVVLFLAAASSTCSVVPLLQAPASGAKVVALANGGGDMVNAVTQAGEFGIGNAEFGRTADLAAAQGLRFITAFRRDRDDETRGWSKRFFDEHGRMPTLAQASSYSAVKHCIAAIAAAGTDEAKTVMAKMRELPVNGFYVMNGGVREDGRLVHDMPFAQVKTPAASSRPWDSYTILHLIPGDQAFRPLAEGGCPLVGH
jgi:branched-chain amino acid transport system substrate-binding protein